MKIRDMDELVFLWKEYGKSRNKDLTKDAQDLKQQVRKFVESLPTFQEDITPQAKRALRKMRDIINLSPDQMKKKLDEIERKHRT